MERSIPDLEGSVRIPAGMHNAGNDKMSEYRTVHFSC